MAMAVAVSEPFSLHSISTRDFFLHAALETGLEMRTIRLVEYDILLSTTKKVVDPEMETMV